MPHEVESQAAVAAAPPAVRLLAVGPGSGGVGDFFEHAVEALRAAGWSVTVLLPPERGSAFLAAARLAIRHRRAPPGGGPPLAQSTCHRARSSE